MITVHIGSEAGRETLLREALESLLANTRPPDKIYLYRDGRSTPTWLHQLQAYHPIALLNGSEPPVVAAYRNAARQHGVTLLCDELYVYSRSYVEAVTDMLYRHRNRVVVGVVQSPYARLPKPEPDDAASVQHDDDSSNIPDIFSISTLAFDTRFVRPPELSPRDLSLADVRLWRWAVEQHIPMVRLSATLVRGVTLDVAASSWSHELQEAVAEVRKLVQSSRGERGGVQRSIVQDFGGTSIEWGLYKQMIEEVSYRARVVEFGSGRTTKYLADWFTLFSLEARTEWLPANPHVHAPIEKGWYSLAQVSESNLKNQVAAYLVDGPTGHRPGILAHLDKLNPEALFFIDDVNRPSDLAVAEAIAQRYGKRLSLYTGEQKSWAVLR